LLLSSPSIHNSLQNVQKRHLFVTDVVQTNYKVNYIKTMHTSEGNKAGIHTMFRSPVLCNSPPPTHGDIRLQRGTNDSPRCHPQDLLRL